MSRLSEIVAYKRQSGQGVTSSLTGGFKERLKEKFDPRQILNQKGLLVSLFPGLKPFKAKTTKSTRTSGKSIEQFSIDVSNVKPIFENIQYNTKFTVKNLSTLPSIHRDFNVIRQNIVKLLKLEKIDAATKADMFFKAASKREEMYESQLAKLKTENKSPSRLQISSSGSILDFLVFGGILALVTIGIKEVVDAIEKIKNIDLKEAVDNFGKKMMGSLESIFSTLTGNEITDVPSVPTGDLNFKDIFSRIRKGESGGKLKEEDYDVSFIAKGQKTAKQFSGKKLTEMTLGEVLEFQRSREKISSGQGAVGAYQFMPTTLFGKEGFSGKGKIGGLVGKSGLSMDTKFSKETQDKLAEILMAENIKALEAIRAPVTPQNLAMAWTIGPSGVAAVNKAIQEGRGEQSVADVLEKAGLPSNRKNNPQLVKNKAKDFYSYYTKKMGYEDSGKNATTNINDSSNTQQKTPTITPKIENKVPNIPSISSKSPNFDNFSLGNKNSGGTLQDKFLDISLGSIVEETPIVIINNNNSEQNVIVVTENNVKQEDYLPKLFREMII